MLEYLAFRNMMWAFTKLPVWIFIGAIACLFWRAPETMHTSRGVYYFQRCMKSKFPGIPSEDWTKDRRDVCMPQAIKKAEAEYAQAQSKK